MKTSAAGRAAIIAREGKRLVAYRDSVGVITIGVGHTGRMSPPPVTPGMRITDAQCDAFLAADLAPVEAVINASVVVPLSQNEFDAMASLGFNIGVNGLRRSSVIRRINLGDVAGAAQAFLAWSKPAVLAGRRRAEKAQFLTPDPVVAKARAARLTELSTAAATRTALPKNAGAAILATGAAAATVTAGWHVAAALVVAAVALAGFFVTLAFVAWGRATAAGLAVQADAEARLARSAEIAAAPKA